MKNKCAIIGPTYTLELPTPAALQAFTRAVTALTRQGFTRADATKRLADRCNLKLIHTPYQEKKCTLAEHFG